MQLLKTLKRLSVYSLYFFAFHTTSLKGGLTVVDFLGPDGAQLRRDFSNPETLRAFCERFPKIAFFNFCLKLSPAILESVSFQEIQAINFAGCRHLPSNAIRVFLERYKEGLRSLTLPDNIEDTALIDLCCPQLSAFSLEGSCHLPLPILRNFLERHCNTLASLTLKGIGNLGELLTDIHFPKLTHLDVTQCSGGTTEFLQRHASTITVLKFSALPESGMEELFFPQLKLLDLKYCDQPPSVNFFNRHSNTLQSIHFPKTIDDGHLTGLRVTALKEVNIPECRHLDPNAVHCFLVAYSPQLEALTIGSCPFADFKIDALIAGIHFPQLSHVNFGNGIMCHPDAMAAFLIQHAPTLIDLKLPVGLNDPMFESLSQVPFLKLASVTFNDKDKETVFSRGLRHFLDQNSKNLRCIHFPYCITPEVVVDLHMPNLYAITFQNCRSIPEEIHSFLGKNETSVRNITVYNAQNANNLLANCNFPNLLTLRAYHCSLFSRGTFVRQYPYVTLLHL